MNETIKTLLSRRSIRAYKTEQLRDEELNLILEAGKYAPSAINQQRWHFSVVQNQDILSKINEGCRSIIRNSPVKELAERANSESFSVFYNAPALIVVSGDPGAILPQIDCSLALGNMFLAAESLGIGSCWINAVVQFFAGEEGKKLKKDLGIPEEYAVYCAGSFGYKAVQTPEAQPRKENIINIIK